MTVGLIDSIHSPTAILLLSVAPYGVVAVEISDYNLGSAYVSRWREYKLLAGWLIHRMYDYIG